MQLKIIIMCYTVPEILPVMDVIFFTFWANNENLKKMKKRVQISSFYKSIPKIMITGYIVPEIWWVTNIIAIFHFGVFFALLPTSNPKNQNFGKIKKPWRYHFT